MSAYRAPRVQPYTWRNGDDSTRGVLIKAGPNNLFVPLDHAHHLADAIVDTAETTEQGDQS